MAKASVEFHPEARAEYLDALSWYRDRSIRAARKLEAEVNQSIQQIVKTPGTWPVYGKACHRFLLHRFPFQIVYSESPDRVMILAVAHSHRRPGYWKHRL